MDKKKFQTPILLIIFNRPELTRQVFEAIRKVKPTKLYIAADGPRENKTGEKKLCDETRKITESVDWQCEVYTQFQEKNLGCKYGPITAIDWFFEKENRGIILEDDCLPNETFFRFCDELLEYYKNNDQIMHISGNNFQNGILRGDKEASYYFSKYTHSWGWATWRRSWNKFHPAINDFDSFKSQNKISIVKIGSKAQKFWIKNFTQTIKGNDSWDSLWMYTVWLNNGLAILPQKNLVSNIGFEYNATHTIDKNSKLSNMKTLEDTTLVHPDTLTQSVDADLYTFKTMYSMNIFFKIKYLLNKIINN